MGPQWAALSSNFQGGELRGSQTLYSQQVSSDLALAIRLNPPIGVSLNYEALGSERDDHHLCRSPRFSLLPGSEKAIQ